MKIVGMVKSSSSRSVAPIRMGLWLKIAVAIATAFAIAVMVTRGSGESVKLAGLFLLGLLCVAWAVWRSKQVGQQ